MKIALCFSGQPRNVQLGYEYIKKCVLDTCNPDVFIHLWKLPDGPIINAGGHVASDPIDKDVYTLVSNLYNPRVMVVQPDAEFDELNYNDRKYPGIRPKFSLSQRYSIMKSLDLKRQWEYTHHFKYDVVLRMRFDWAIRTLILPQEYDMTGVTVTDDCPHPNSINDQFALGPSHFMDIYGDLFNNIPQYFNDDGVVFCDEILLAHHLRKKNVPIFKRPISYGLIRNKDHTDWGRP